MANIIDPILGVPSTVLNIPSYQHEYTKTPVPYNDLLPVPEPPRGLVYPDNAPPVLANLNAFYDGARQSQNVHTDGNHALLVSNVGGGGGAPPIGYSWVNSLSYLYNAFDSGDKFIGSLGGNILARLHVSACITGNSGSAVNYNMITVSIGPTDGSSGPASVIQLSLGNATPSRTAPIIVDSSFELYPALDLRGVFGNHSFGIYVAANPNLTGTVSIDMFAYTL